MCSLLPAVQVVPDADKAEAEAALQMCRARDHALAPRSARPLLSPRSHPLMPCAHVCRPAC